MNTRMASDTDPSAKQSVPHYYGDPLRRLFVANAILSVFVIPLWGDLLPFGTFFELGGALFLVVLAGLTNPHSPTVAVVDSIVAALGALLLETAAINFFHTQSIILFIVRETGAIIFLFALYFGVKTVRAMLLKQVGHQTDQGEF